MKYHALNFVRTVAALLLPALAQAQMPTGQFIPVPAQKEGIPLLSGCTDYRSEQWLAAAPDDRSIRNVICPTLTPVLPAEGKGNGVAMIVAPGGAFRILSWDHEGTKVAHWLADHGIAAFILKYRLVPMPRDNAGFTKAVSSFITDAVKQPKLDTSAEALADGQAAVRLVRARATAWKIDPNKVGFVGFSAGAMTTLSVGLAEDKVARPNFIAPIYPPMMARDIPSDAPPMFLAIALDDTLFAAGKPLGLIDAYRTAHRPLEVHLYEKGNHGFGMAGRTASAALWIDELYAWMKDRKLVGK